MKKITFNAATAVGPEPREGYRVELWIGGERHWFVLQMEGDRPKLLTHWASGYKLADIGPDMLERYVRRPSTYSGGILEWRKCAQAKLDSVVAINGRDKVLAKLASVPVINVRKD